ncbi:hypothetical protein PR202_gb11141 [Eleusine coracana subsp. coracana]|uniref:F-box domain-containing protein n=1 Tax=Eleusine coracana subsp. coracana TaxID=191504 RepID=A0AAV5EM80_ELECO|nr:hypothetical protein PR202_gb11141 [Eleusine coracana subsp. coracana]
MGLPLPEDALAYVLRRLSPRSLAASRCVCKAWRDIIDSRSLLLPDLLPHSVRGIFLMYHDLDFPAFLSHPSTEPEIFDKLDLYRLHPDPYLESFTDILDHRNGLLLYHDLRGMHVANATTQRRAQLPPAPHFGPDASFSTMGHLLFDPTESPHFEWEERAFIREGEATMMAFEEIGDPLWQATSAYWRGAFFVQCNDGSAILRTSVLNTFLGFHPFKDVVFLNVSLDRAVAYHLDTCTIQDLGEVRPRYYHGPVASVISSFVYTPC